MNTPTLMREEAIHLRQRAEELADENPTAAEYLNKRADYCDYLARKEEEQEGGAA